MSRPWVARASTVSLAVLCAVLASGLFGGRALADGDPASDVLITHSYYVPADAKASTRQEDQLGSLLQAADRAGLPIRVAVIPAEYDLGSALQAWRRPQSYSEFLGYELSNSYKSALLIVMPNGFGLNWPDHPMTQALRSLSAVKVRSGRGGLLTSAEAAVRVVAAAGGVRLAAGSDAAAAASSSSSASHGIPTIAIVIVFAWALAIAAFVVVRRARRRPPRPARAAQSRPSGAAQPRPRLALSRLVALEAGAMSIALVVGVVLVVMKVTTQSAQDPAAGVNAPFLFHAGRRPAPAFKLTGQHGQPVTLAAYRGRPVIVTFIDPLCRNLCPLAAHVLNQLDRELPAAKRVPIIAVSVDVYADTPADLRQDFRRWGLVPQWTWAVGSGAQLAAVWKRYEVGVSVVTKSVAGITEHIVSHDELAYVIDPAGYERALFFWPYAPQGVEQVLAAVSRA
jgi:cytochrome oxidase Cu insertion factor (SCO1/SenC/PrrC family)